MLLVTRDDKRPGGSIGEGRGCDVDMEVGGGVIGVDLAVREWPRAHQRCRAVRGSKSNGIPLIPLSKVTWWPVLTSLESKL